MNRCFINLSRFIRAICGLAIAAGMLVSLTSCSKNVSFLDKRDRSDSLVEKAIARKNQGQIESAIRLYQDALDNNSKLARAHLDLAVLLHDNAEEKDHIRAIYHYQRYIELRPETEKREMIENRIRLASQSFAASVTRSDSEDIEALKKKNAILEEKLRQVNQKIKDFKSGQRGSRKY
ncbi:hypothetical protein ACFLS1_03120 [Verrucomicrobiota bacterium]